MRGENGSPPGVAERGYTVAYQILETNLLQSAIKAASQVTAALITAGDDDAKVDPQAVMNTIADDLFSQLKAKADADNEQLKQEAKDNPQPRGGGGGNYRKGGGNVESDGSMKLTWGKFKGHTIAEIYEMDEDEAGALGYDKAGAAWVEWLSKNRDPKSKYSADRAKAFLDAKRG